MPFEKGHKKIGGRKPGAQNKTAVAAKEAFRLAFEGLGGVAQLIEWGKENLSEFYRLYGRLIPVDTHISGSIEHRNIEVDFSDGHAESQLPTEAPTVN